MTITFDRETLLRLHNTITSMLEEMDAKSAPLPEPPETFTVSHKRYGDLLFRRMNQHDHKATYFMAAAIPNHEFCPPEALCLCPNGLKAGTYHDPARYFTLEQDVPAGGCLVIDWYRDTISSYEDIFSLEPLETVNYRSGEDGTDLIHAVGRKNCNYDPSTFERDKWVVYCGRGDYRSSPIYQWMNSDEENWWRQQNPFDRPPSYVREPGFLTGFSLEFLTKLERTEQICATNKVLDPFGQENSSYTVPCLFFLPSFTQLTGQPNNGVMEGELWQECDGVWDEVNSTYQCQRLQKLSTADASAVWYWQRSCNPGYSCYARDVSRGGGPGRDGGACYPTDAVAAACVISF